MNPVSHFSMLVSQTMARSPNLDYNAAARLTAQAHPGLAVLASACGKTKSSTQFLNARLSGAPSRAAAREDLQKEVQRVMATDHCNYQVAWNRVTARSVTFSNSADMEAIRAAASGGGGLPAFSPELASVFRLPADTTPIEWKAAWEGNGSTATAINYGKIFNELASLTQNATGKNIEDAITPTKERFPELWSAVEQLAKLSF
jgi:hypothetical protein